MGLRAAKGDSDPETETKRWTMWQEGAALLSPGPAEGTRQRKRGR